MSQSVKLDSYPVLGRGEYLGASSSRGGACRAFVGCLEARLRLLLSRILGHFVSKVSLQPVDFSWKKQSTIKSVTQIEDFTDSEDIIK